MAEGRVKAVPSEDCLVIMGRAKAEIHPEKTITLSSLIAPRLVSLYCLASSTDVSHDERALPINGECRIIIVLGCDNNLLGNQVSRVEPNTNLTDHAHISTDLQCLHELLGSDLAIVPKLFTRSALIPAAGKVGWRPAAGGRRLAAGRSTDGGWRDGGWRCGGPAVSAEMEAWTGHGHGCCAVDLPQGRRDGRMAGGRRPVAGEGGSGGGGRGSATHGSDWKVKDDGNKPGIGLE